MYNVRWLQMWKRVLEMHKIYEINCNDIYLPLRAAKVLYFFHTLRDIWCSHMLCTMTLWKV